MVEPSFPNPRFSVWGLAARLPLKVLSLCSLGALAVWRPHLFLHVPDIRRSRVDVTMELKMCLLPKGRQSMHLSFAQASDDDAVQSHQRRLLNLSALP